MPYRFKVFGLKSRGFQGEVPFEVSRELTRVLQGVGSGELTLDVTSRHAPADWEQSILQWRNIIIAVDEQDNILWNGVPWDRVPVSPSVMAYPCETLEGYLRWRYAPTAAFVQQDQADIARALASVCGDAVGIPLEYDCPKTGVLRDASYAADENGEIYTRLQELASTDNGFDWTISVEWENQEHTRLRYVFRTGYPHLGNRTPTPEHLFSLPGNVTSLQGSESWAKGAAATAVQGSGDGTGVTKLVSELVVDTVREAAGWPRLEERLQFAGESTPEGLAGSVRAGSASLFGGQDMVTITVRDGVGTSPRDITLGDTARVIIETPTKNADTVPVVVGLSLLPNSSEFKPTLARLEAL